MCIARIHTEILIEELSIPLMDGSYLHSKEYFACAQPDCLDSEEFNLILFTDVGIKRACSNDFDFFEMDGFKFEENKWIKKEF